jgi:hypothetical protein
MSKVSLRGPLFRLAIEELENEQVAPAGNGDPQDSEIDCGNGPVGVTVT